ncbi:MAG TPA: cation-transporting P-type ATPase [Candidatus Woesearchaeota archaeon]|nr:cation-transporting P-type ATPase [Candidatus Woesearchaeota archaeon]
MSRSVADLTLKDDNFNTIVAAISEGRTIFKNIRKFVTYQLSCNFSELAILFLGVLLAPMFGWQIPLLLALHILFMNLITDNLPAITLGLNPTSTDIMSEHPRKDGGILNAKLLGVLIFAGSLMTFFVILGYFVDFNILGKSVEHSRTIALTTLIGLEIVSAFHFRSFRKGVLTRSPFTNPALIIASLLSILATLAILYTPLNIVFETVPLMLYEFWPVFAICLIFIIIFDVLKFLNKKLKFLTLEHC